MGGKKSKPAAEAPLLDEPWREINWKDKQRDLQHVNNFKHQTEGQQLRILLHGPVGAGMSSFINSVNSVLQGRMCTLALVDNTSHGCFSKEYTIYKIQKGSPETFYPFVFNDIMGLSQQESVLVDDVKLALLGHVKEGYVVQHSLDSDTIHHETVQKIRDIRTEASRLGIPQVAVLTKVDKACPEIRRDLKNIYRRKYLREKMEEFSAHVGIPMNCTFPVKNYHEEIDISDDTDAVTLSTLRRIIDHGGDFINRKTV
ncbi:interferon-induced protein 44-like [Trachinotus anak]|uniref:interferon-induced protein 44-like n=1 Tax=Trachinotus anak TaxID=443729 RepID=UPI0039F1FF1D